ncbi:MAG: sigma-70 family RNA polymerase sigma factor [Candidatus Marinimicrobia bacterium]|nr:sigma-70 family RNA polymerase sigma factor [Candidatus Neomarinimicrobiota bacterium]
MDSITEELIQLAKSGDKKSLSIIINVYSEKLYGLSFKFMRNREDAEDVLQETFLKMINKINVFKGDSTLYSWLYRITVNTALEKLRKHHPSHFDVNLDKVDYNQHDEMPSFEIPYLEKKDLKDLDFRNELNVLLKKMNSKLRVIFILRDIEGNSVQDTAKILNLSETNVKVRLMRARMFLKENLTDYFRERIVS